MAVYLLILFCLCLIDPGSRLNSQGIRTDYISREQTDVIRGLFILMIIASHYAWSLPDLADSLGRIYQRIWIWQEQLVVCASFSIPDTASPNPSAKKAEAICDPSPGSGC